MRQDRAGWCWALALAAAYGVVGYIRHRNHHTGFDLAVFDQAAWQLSSGRSHVSIVERPIFADHFSPAMVLFAPLYRLAATPAWLFAAQGAALGLTLLPVRALARELGASARLATWLVVASAPLLAAGHYDFHASTLAVPFLALAVLRGRQGEARGALLASAAVVVCRADLAWVLVGIAIVARGRARVALLASGIVGTGLGVVAPEVLGNPGTWEPYYGHLGEDPADAALHPWRIPLALMGVDPAAVVLFWLLPVGLVVLARPRWLAALLVAGAPVLLSRWQLQSQPWWHYGAIYVPITIGAALDVLGGPGVLGRRLAQRQLGLVAVVGSVLALVLFSPLARAAPDHARLWATMRPLPDRDLASAVAHVSDDESVSASYHALAQLAHRERLHIFPIPFVASAWYFPQGLEPRFDRDRPPLPDVVVLDLMDPYRGEVELPGYVRAAVVTGFEIYRRADAGG